jgi:pSer/pThr/pTyr-binding forkhead associated (FHA) protein
MTNLHLRLLDGPHFDATYSFDGPLVSLGRDDTNDVCLGSDTGVSGTHAKLTFEGAYWFLEDCGSTNGTFVKTHHAFERVRGKTQLVSGQSIKLGRSQILVSIGSEDQETLIVANEHQPQADEPLQHETPERNITTPVQRIRQLLRVELVDDQLRYELATQGAIGARSTTPYNAADVDHLRSKFFDLAFRARQYAAAQPKSDGQKIREELIDTGKLLAHLVFPKRIHAAIANSDLQSLSLVHTSPLVGIPWELAVVGTEPIGTQFSFGRQVMLDRHSSIMDVTRDNALPIQRPRLLIVCNPTGDLEELESKTESLLEQLQTVNLGWHIEFVARDRVERLDLLSRLSKSDFVYYVGHAEYDETTPENSGWLLRDGRLTCQDIRRLPRAPHAVFANGCETGREADWNEGRSLRDHAFGLASAFLLSGTSCYLGASWPIAPDSAGTFAQFFFEQLMAGGPLGECVRNARLETRNAFSDADLTWVSYIMYGDPAAQFFSTPGKSS